MAVSRRLRYEILRRDNHACTYCGGSAPDVKLTVDHVVPVALGGTDEPSNLTTACQDCNAGKSASSPDAPIVDSVAQDALRWSAAMKQAAEMQAESLAVVEEFREGFDSAWCGWTYGEQKSEVPRPTDWARSVEIWQRAGMSGAELADAIRRAMSNSKVTPAGTWAYTCGIIWGKLRERQELAQQIVEQSPPTESVGLSEGVTDDFAQTPSWWSVTKEQAEAWCRIVERFPDLKEWSFGIVDVVKAAAHELPDADPTSVWYGFGDFKQQFGEGIKHRWVREADRLELSDAEASDGYQYLVTMVYDYWAMATNGA